MDMSMNPALFAGFGAQAMGMPGMGPGGMGLGDGAWTGADFGNAAFFPNPAFDASQMPQNQTLGVPQPSRQQYPSNDTSRPSNRYQGQDGPRRGHHQGRDYGRDYPGPEHGRGFSGPDSGRGFGGPDHGRDYPRHDRGRDYARPDYGRSYSGHDQGRDFSRHDYPGPRGGHSRFGPRSDVDQSGSDRLDDDHDRSRHRDRSRNADDNYRSAKDDADDTNNPRNPADKRDGHGQKLDDDAGPDARGQAPVDGDNANKDEAAVDSQGQSGQDKQMQAGRSGPSEARDPSDMPAPGPEPGPDPGART